DPYLPGNRLCPSLGLIVSEKPSGRGFRFGMPSSLSSARLFFSVSLISWCRNRSSEEIATTFNSNFKILQENIGRERWRTFRRRLFSKRNHDYPAPFSSGWRAPMERPFF